MPVGVVYFGVCSARSVVFSMSTLRGSLCNRHFRQSVSRSDCILYRYVFLDKKPSSHTTEALDVLRSASQSPVAAFAGHHHGGGVAVDPIGSDDVIHHIVLPSPLTNLVKPTLKKNRVSFIIRMFRVGNV